MLPGTLGGIGSIDGLLDGIPSGVFGFRDGYGKCAGEDVGEVACGYGELEQAGVWTYALGGAEETVCKVVHDVVVDVFPACANPLVLYMGFAAVERCGGPRSGESCKLARHKWGVAVVAVFKLGVYAVKTICHRRMIQPVACVRVPRFRSRGCCRTCAACCTGPSSCGRVVACIGESDFVFGVGFATAEAGLAFKGELYESIICIRVSFVGAFYRFPSFTSRVKLRLSISGTPDIYKPLMPSAMGMIALNAISSYSGQSVGLPSRTPVAGSYESIRRYHRPPMIS